ncbi:MAG: hypothetical protein ACTS3T_18170 [Almyronema sp.]
MNVSKTAPQSSDLEVKSPVQEDERICWIEVKQYPFQADHQVELLHLLAEADALLLQLQTSSSEKLSCPSKPNAALGDR